ncbi:hypothetical protein Y1Q_0014503 [Alligator mississippiensis]|uniref:Uncharacterized protein n=1 Tax=Alligator mississippiensis TaxID=8496 RepID=A0A151PCV7_ALLMI|nr:hypothetical protein Y1Q_0014503 [Alligator mississippiensis]
MDWSGEAEEANLKITGNIEYVGFGYQDTCKPKNGKKSCQDIKEHFQVKLLTRLCEKETLPCVLVDHFKKEGLRDFRSSIFSSLAFGLAVGEKSSFKYPKSEKEIGHRMFPLPCGIPLEVSVQRQKLWLL